MDRLGSFTFAAALVMVSALHMIDAPTYTVIVPTLLAGAGLVRLWTTRGNISAAVEGDPAMLPATEG